MESNNFIEFFNIEKEFPGVKALDNISFGIEKGEIHALVGENGAGKTTLINLCSGVLLPEKGEIHVKGEKVILDNPLKSERLKIATVYQEVPLCLNMTISQNIFLGTKPKMKFGVVIDWNYLNGEAQKLIDMFELDLNPGAKVGDLTIAEQSLVQIMKAFHLEPEMLILDEPTSALSGNQKDLLFKVIRKVRSERELTIMYVSHRLDEIFELCDSVTVLRDGLYVDTVRTKDIVMDDMVKMMVGRNVERRVHAERAISDKVVLEVERVNLDRKVKDVSFKLREGEILGFAGFQGAGRTETMRAIFGLDKKDSGTVIINGEKVTIRSPEDAIKKGIIMCPENRREEGIVPQLSVKKSIIMSILEEISTGMVLNSPKIIETCRKYVELLDIRITDFDQNIETLSGGNQQKTIFSRSLATGPRILICDEPTRGIDVGAKSEIYDLLLELANSGMSIIVVSSELPEIISISDRVIVMHEGKITGELDAKDVSEERIMMYAASIA